MTSPPTASPDRRQVVLGLLCAVQFMLLAGDTMVNVALPSIQDQLQVDQSLLAWVVNGYLVAFGGLLVLAGRVGDRVGLGRTLVIGLSVFGLASVLCGVATSGSVLVTGRVLQGVGAAVVAPSILGMLTVVFPAPEERARAFAAWGAAATTGGLAGMLLSGVLTDLLSWRAAFLVNVPLVVAAVVLLPALTRRVIPGPNREVEVPIGVGVLVTVATGSTVFAVLAVPVGGTVSVVVLLPLAIAVFAAGILVLRARRGLGSPLVPVGLLGTRLRASGLGVASLATGSIFAAFFVLTIHLQSALGYSPLEAALAFVPFGVGSLIGIGSGSRVVTRWGGSTALAGFTIVGTLGVVVAVVVVASNIPVLLPVALAVFGLGASGSLPHAVGLAVSAVEPVEAGVAGSVVNSAQQLWGAFALASTATALSISSQNVGLALSVAAVTMAVGAAVAVRSRTASPAAT